MQNRISRRDLLNRLGVAGAAFAFGAWPGATRRRTRDAGVAFMSTAKPPRRVAGARPTQRAASLDAEDASEPILVLNCGSSSIKFALFDAKVFLVPRKPRWSGRIEGVGGTDRFAEDTHV